MSKKYTTNFLEDTNGSTGSANQVLVSTAAGIDWVDGSGSSIIGGPYLPLAGGTMTGDLRIESISPKIYLKDTSDDDDQAIYFQNNASTIEYVISTQDFTGAGLGDGMFIGSISNDKLALVTNNSTALYIDTDQNVGIGTTSPSTKLHVAGIVQVTESGNTAFYGGNYLRVFNDQVYTMRNSGGNQRFAFDNTSGSLSTYNSSNARTTYFNNSGSSYINGGNVGIGTTTPANKLTVNGPIEAINSNGPTHFIARFDSTYFTTYTTDSVKFDGTGQSYNFIQNGTNRMSINSAGNVGIGTTSPAYKLDVNGTARVQGRLTIPGFIVHEGDIGTSIGFSSNDTIALSTNGSTKLEINAFGQTAITGSLRVGTDVFNSLSISSGLLGTTYTTNANGLNSQPDISFRTGSTTRLKINGVNGNVGIGTTSPAAKLQILDNAEQPQLRVGTDASNYLDIKAGSLSTSFTATGSGFVSPDINFNTNGTKLSIKGLTGFVGIGSGTPSEMLEVFGNVQAETLIATDLTDGYVPWNRNGTLGLQDSEIYQDNGQVGIGTTTLSQALNVDGDVLADGYRVTGMQTAPSGKGDTGTLGEIRITQNYIYVCYATNSWSRVALETSW